MQLTPNSIIYGLPQAEWRGDVFPPYDVAGFGFSHRQAERQYYGVDGSSHRWGGMNTTPMRFKLYFLNTLLDYAFPDKWQTWQELLFDGKPGKLLHPLRGLLDAVVVSGDVDLKAQTTAGIIAEVTWSDTLLDPTKAQKLAIVDITPEEVAAAAVEAINNAELNFPSGEPVGDLFDILDQLDSLLYSVDVTLQGQINSWQSKLDRFIAIIQGQAPGTKSWAAGDLLIRLWNVMEDRKRQVLQNQSRPTATATATNQTTIDAIARERENTVGEIMTLNPSLLGSSYVPKGTIYTYYTG